MADREVITRAITQSWDAFTSAHRHWTPENPPLGQSGVTALAVQELLGGNIMHQTVKVEGWDIRPHFSNVLPDGDEVDLTMAQYDETAEFAEDKRAISPEEIFSRYRIASRHDLLMTGVRSLLHELEYSRRPGDPK